MAPDDVGVARLAVRGETHQLVLTRVHLEAGEVGEGRVQQAQGVREAHLSDQANPVAAPHAVAGGGPFAHAVQRQDRGLLERRRKEGARGMRLVVLGEDEPPGVRAAQTAPQLARQIQLLAQPQRHRLEERPKPLRRVGEVGLEQALELQERLVVEADVVQLLGGHARLAQAVGDGLGGEVVVVLLAGEALFLRRGDDRAVDQQGRGGVVVERRDPQNRRHRLSSSPTRCASAGSRGALPSSQQAGENAESGRGPPPRMAAFALRYGPTGRLQFC